MTWRPDKDPRMPYDFGPAWERVAVGAFLVGILAVIIWAVIATA